MNSTAGLGFMNNLLEESDDPVLKLGLREEPGFFDYANDTLVENWPSDSYDLLDSLNLTLDNQFNQFNLDMDNPSTPSDPGMYSTQSISSEDQQLSPFLPMEEEETQEDDTDVAHNVPDFESVNSSNESIESESSPDWGTVNYDAYSPSQTDTSGDHLDLQKSFILDPSVDLKTENVSLLEVQNSVDYDMEQAEVPCITIPEIKPTGTKRSIKQVIRVTPIGSANPRSILLPVSLKDMKDVKTIKIINASQAHHIKGYKISQDNSNQKSNPQVNIKYERVIKTEKVKSESSYPQLKLNAEEKRLLQKEGITLPSHYPLTKLEERELKRIRRKIRNKISAQDSRKRKKEYVDGLEDRVKQCHEENVELLKRINVLQSENQNLASQVKKLQAFIQKENKTTQPTTCLLILLLSLALVAVPNLRPHSANNSTELQDSEMAENLPSLTGRTRTLLSTQQLLDKELQQYEEEILPEVEGLLDHDYSPLAEMPPTKRFRFSQEEPRSPNLLNSLQNRKYIEPPLDDVWPPPKPGEARNLSQRFSNDLKINISANVDTRTVLLKRK